MTKYTDEELGALIAFGEPYNREGDVDVLNALIELKEVRTKLKIAIDTMVILRQQGPKLWCRPAIHGQQSGAELSPAERLLDETIEEINK